MNNQIITSGFKYDAAGNMMSDSINDYAWNGEGQVTSVGGWRRLSDTFGGICEVGAAPAADPVGSLFGELARWYHASVVAMSQEENCRDVCATRLLVET